MVNDFNKNHPELHSDEMHIMNHDPAGMVNFSNLPYATKRLGEVAYDMLGNRLEALKPIFVKKSEFEVKQLKTQKAYYVGTHEYSFRAGQPAEIVGVVMIPHVSGEVRPCYHVRYADGHEDYSVIKDINNYKIVGEVEATTLSSK